MTELCTRAGAMSLACSTAALARPTINGVRSLITYSIGQGLKSSSHRKVICLDFTRLLLSMHKSKHWLQLTYVDAYILKAQTKAWHSEG